MNTTYATVIETAAFLRAANRLFTEAEREELVVQLASQPHLGDVIPQTGGVRKLRWSAGGKGKRGGTRVIYYYHDLENPLLLFTAYGKNEKADLTEAEKKTLRHIVEELKRQFTRRNQ